jgi:hypothetical protein
MAWAGLCLQLLLWFFGFLAFVIIMSAAFNYTNLTIAKSDGRYERDRHAQSSGQFKKTHPLSNSA